MFDGVPADQFHQFIASSRASLPIPLPFSLHHHQSHGAAAAPVPVPSSAPPPPPPTVFPGGFDLYPSQHQLVQPQLHHHQSPPPPTDGGKSGGESAAEEEQWSNDEVLTLLRIRSSMENWFPEYTWEHVSRKLGEHGYQRSADKCKEKFEEESRHFNTNMGFTNNSTNKNYRFFSDLDELYHHGHDISKAAQELGKGGAPQHHDHEEQEEEDAAPPPTAATNNNPSSSNHQQLAAKEAAGSKKRKRKQKFEMLKGFCEDVVKRIVAQQEDLHDKLIQDMVRRDEESIAREKAWKSQEMERINKEIEARAQEQVVAWERQAKIIDLLKNFTASSSGATGTSEEDQDLMAKIEEFFKVRKTSTTPSTTCVTSSSEILPPASSMSNLSHHHNPTSSSTTEATPSPQNQYYSSLKSSGQSPSKMSPFSPPPPSSSEQKKVEGQDVAEYQHNRVGGGGKRWPREEVQALIKLKCETSTRDESNKEFAGSKGPLWERISWGMKELGYNRNAKRCKEKWENINKYFRKTKDSKKKRSVESRTCPYFHQLNALYTQGTLLTLPPPPPADLQPDQSQ